MGVRERGIPEIMHQFLSQTMVYSDFETTCIRPDPYNERKMKPHQATAQNNISATFKNIFDLYRQLLEKLKGETLENARNLSFQSYLLTFQEKNFIKKAYC